MPEATREIWEETERGFYEEWDFPNSSGSIDGKHVTLQCPKNSGSQYLFYLQKFSVVLKTVGGSHYKFTCADNSGGGIFGQSTMGRRFEAGTHSLPDDQTLPGQNKTTPHVGW